MTKLLSELAKGTWSNATSYTIGDIVDNDGSSYVCIANNTNQEPPNTDYWALLSKKGDTGVSDTPGDTGVQGDTGVTGATGVQGATGSAGVKGDTGSAGATGAGTQGDTGTQGDQGDTGITGATGAGTTGATGTSGNKGDTGVTGAKGDTGNSGAKGDTGTAGSAGSAGAKGDTGTQGATGAGIQGDSGEQGPQGDTGIQGATGAGIQGATGSGGAKGDTGTQGSTGSKGDTGVPGGSLDWKGDWLTSTSYSVDDAVQHGSPTSSYRCISAHTSGSTTEPGVGASWETNWQLIAEAGEKGATGTQGDTGAGLQGSTGVTGATGNTGATGIQGSTGTSGSAGATGNPGGGETVLMTYSATTTDTDPGTGIVRLNNATLASVTQIFIDLLTPASADITTWLDSLDDSTSTVKGYLRLARANSPTANYVIFQLNSITSATGYRKLNVTHVSSVGSLNTTASNTIVTFTRNGDKGNTGDTGTAGSQGATGTKGDTGNAGSAGTTGNTGVQGATGVTGATGTSGSAGAKGDTGNTGATGTSGSAGAKGDTGTQGDTGVEGTQYPWEGQWITATAYALNDCVHHNGSAYICISAHTSGSTTEPGVGASWETYWSLLVEPPTTVVATPGADHQASGLKITLTANENQAFGDVCYINSSGEAQLGDADAIASSVIVAMAIETISADASGLYLLLGIARDDTWTWTVGGKIYLSTTGTTGNTLTQTPPSGTDDCIVEVGVATHADRMLFNPTIQAIVEHA